MKLLKFTTLQARPTVTDRTAFHKMKSFMKLSLKNASQAATSMEVAPVTNDESESVQEAPSFVN